MYCVIQEIELKKPNKHGRPKELISEYTKMSFNGRDLSHYTYYYSQERFERPVRKAYKISIHKSYREDGKLKKKQYTLCTVNYYDFADNWFSQYDYCGKKIDAISGELGVDVGQIDDLVENKLKPLIDEIQSEFRQTEEYKTHEEHERITTLYAANKAKFNEKYGCDRYDQIYDVFGNLMNEKRLEEVKADFKAHKEHEEKGYQGQYSSGYFNIQHSNYSEDDKETLKQFYKVLSKKFHPDSNPDTDTSKQMQLLNQLKEGWGV